MRAVIIAVTLSGLVCVAGQASAQSWSVDRQRPALWQISSVDASGEPLWPYGREDIAGDGLAAFEADEAGSDLRTVYADATDEQLFIRAYVAAESAPPEELIAFFFLDTDRRNATGGDAVESQLWPQWESDPSVGGYERAVVVRGDGTLLDAFEFVDGEWVELMTMPSDVQVEVDVDRDPIRIGELRHGYVQVVLSHDLFGLDASCEGNIFVRLWHDAMPRRTFGDEDDQPALCRAPLDRLGDPVVLRAGGCSDDAECPADGECVDGLCVFGYECSDDVDCRSGDDCVANVCMRAPGDACSSDGDCDGLVCEGGSCGACAQSGARACAGGRVCAPDGSCLPPGGANPDSILPGQVRGGAFECSARPPDRGASWFGGLLLLAAVMLILRSRRGQS